MPNHQEQPTPAASPSIGADERRGLTGGGAAHAHSFLRDQKQQTLAGKRGKGGNKGGSRHGSKADLTAEEEDGSTEDVAARGKGKDKGKVKVKRPTAVSPDSDAEVVGELLEQRAAEALQRKASTASLGDAAQQGKVKPPVTGKWSEAEKEALRKALTKLPLGTADRWTKAAAAVPGRSVADVTQMAKEGLNAKPADDAYATFLAQRKGGTPNTSTDDLAAAGASPEGGGEKVVAWTQAQELALVRAFKEFGKDTPERWDRIASAVPGGFTKAHCQRRMTQLHAHLKEAKGQPTGSSSN